MSHKIKMVESIAEILKAYTSGEEPWMIGYSGGKDSTVMTAQVFRALLALKPEQRKRKIHITSAQTHLDLTTDPTKQREYQRMKNIITLFNLPIEIHELSASVENHLLNLWVGKGYPLASKARQYCTDRAKLDPQREFEKKYNPGMKLIGVRLSESAARAASIGKHQTSEYYGEGTIPTFMPIINFTLDDVWSYLAIEKTPWGDAEEISQLYKDATGECGLRKKKAGNGEKADDPCGARFGCIVCPVVTIDKSTREMAKRYPWYQPYADVRDTMIEMYTKPENRAGYMRSGEETFYGEGTFNIRARMELFDLFMEAQQLNEVLATQKNVEPQPIFTEKLIQAIKKQWHEDIQKRPWLMDAEELGMFFEERPKGVRGRKGHIPSQIAWNHKFAL